MKPPLTPRQRMELEFLADGCLNRRGKGSRARVQNALVHRGLAEYPTFDTCRITPAGSALLKKEKT